MRGGEAKNFPSRGNCLYKELQQKEVLHIRGIESISAKLSYRGSESRVKDDVRG